MDIIKTLFKKILSGVFVLVSVVVIVSSIIYLAPVDPTRLTFGQRSDSSTVLRKQQELGMDQSLTVQLISYLSDISPIVVAEKSAYGNKQIGIVNFGSKALIFKWPTWRESFQSGRPVEDLFRESIPKTLILALASFIFAAILGLFFGVVSALNKGSFLDRLLLTFSTLGISVPSYVAAIFLAIIFAYILRPITGLNMQGSIFEINDYGDDIIVLKNLILPSIALGIRPISIITQLTRSAFLDVLNQPYIRTAKAKGITFIQVLQKHVSQNAMNPIITSLTGWLASLMAGAYFVEKVFNFKGLGEMTINALLNYDVPVILASMIFVCIVFIVINILTDMLYYVFDPSLRK